MDIFVENNWRQDEKELKKTDPYFKVEINAVYLRYIKIECSPITVFFAADRQRFFPAFMDVTAGITDVKTRNYCTSYYRWLFNALSSARVVTQLELLVSVAEKHCSQFTSYGNSRAAAVSVYNFYSVIFGSNFNSNNKFIASFNEHYRLQILYFTSFASVLLLVHLYAV